VEYLEQENRWVENEKAKFGQPGEYDFSEFDSKRENMRFYQMKGENERLKRIVNVKVEEIANSAEENFA